MDKLIQLLDELMHTNRYLKFHIEQLKRNVAASNAQVIILERKLQHNTQCIYTIQGKIDEKNKIQRHLNRSTCKS